MFFDEGQQLLAGLEARVGVLGMSADGDLRLRLRQSIARRDGHEGVAHVIGDAVEQRAGALADGHDVARHVVAQDAADEALGSAIGESLKVEVAQWHGCWVAGLLSTEQPSISATRYPVIMRRRLHLRTRVLLLTGAFAVALFAVTWALSSRALMPATLAVAWIIVMLSFAAVQVTLRKVVQPL